MPQSRKLRPSSTAGRTKGANCHRSQLKNLYAKDSRMYKKDPDLYIKACELANSQKGAGGHKSQWIEDTKN
jgi:hypothetical protein